jgi:reductive dehalogenase
MYGWEDERLAPNVLPDDLIFPRDDPKYNTRLVKEAARFYGADMVGICRHDRRWIYTKGYHLITREEYDIHIPDEYQYVINIAVASDYEYYKYAPAFPAAAAVGLGYSKMAFVAGHTAQFLRQLGYRAIPSGNDTALNIPYAIQAGLGELGRQGVLITPKFGPRVRLCMIFTDFPLVCDEPMEFGVTQFCEACLKCAKHCPGQAISRGPRTTEPTSISNAGGSLKWYVDVEKCYRFWAKNGIDCGNCIRVCAFNKPVGKLHDLTRWFIEHFPQMDSAITRADDLFGYGKQADLAGFWPNPPSPI